MRMKMTGKLLFAGVTSIAGANFAHAGSATSYAYLEIIDFTFAKSDGTAINPGSDINVLGAPTSSSNTSSTLNGITINNQNLTGLDSLQSIQGATVGENIFTDQSLATSFSRGDTTGSGNILDISVGGGADAIAVAETDLMPVSDGKANSQLNLNVSFEFIALATINTKISFDAIWSRMAAVDSDLITPSSAEANTTFSVNISQLGVGTVYSNSFGLTEGVSADPFFSSDSSSSSGSFNDTLPTLLAGQRYRLTIDHGASTAAIAVPSPSSMVFGLLGLTAVGIRRRRNSKVA